MQRPINLGMSGAIAAASTGMTAAQRSMSITAHDLAVWSSGYTASVATPGSVASEAHPDRHVVLRETTPGVAADVVTSERAISGIDEAVELITTPHIMASNAAVIRTAVATYESVMNLVPRSGPQGARP